MAVNLAESPSGMLVDRFLELWDHAQAPPDLDAFLAQNAGASPQERLEVVLVDQHRRYEAGCPRSPGSYLAAHPDVADDPDRRVAVVYEDYRIRLDRGESPDPQEYLDRYSDIREALGRQFEVARWMAQTGEPGSPGNAEPEDPGRGGDLGVLDADAEAAPLSSSDFELGPAFPAGGMGVVRRAWQKSLRRRVALKTLKEVGSPSLIRRFLEEARTVARLRHPGIVPIFGLGRFPDGHFFLVMDLIDGPSLAERMKVASIPAARAARYIADAAEAIQQVHDQGVIHRDLKPGNILIDRSGRALVTDFGLAKRLDADTPGESHPGQIIGTPDYMAPEQVDRRWGSIGPATDIYGLGSTLYALLTGRPPFVSPNRLDVLRRISSDEPAEPIHGVRPDVPEVLEAICLKCLRKDPEQRYASASALARDLRDWSSGLSTSVTPSLATTDRQQAPAPPAGAAIRSGPGTPWRRWWLAAAILLMVAVALPFTLRGLIRTEPVKIEVLRLLRGRKDKITAPLTMGPVVKGEGVAVQCRFSRPAYPYLFWVHGNGSVERPFPETAREARRADQFRWPMDRSKLSKIMEGEPGTELAILVVRDEPWTDDDLAQLMGQLRPATPLAALHPETVLVDESPIEKSRGGAHPEEEMMEAPVISYLQDIRKKLEPHMGTVGTIALTLVEKR